ncbi:MAG: pyridoxamine 5'-phosphate oxidase family protein [Acidimicrobiia bacterium]|nr:pyridoxamine 5'-phosphate oxidase family protein [Acidimicrobiia bacterium]
MAAKPSPRMTPDEIGAFVADGHTGIFTTLRRDGMPVAMPMWYAALDGRIYLQTRGKKIDRIRHDPRASFLVESGERWADLKAVHYTGRAELVDLDAATSKRFNAEIERKYSTFRSRDAMAPETAAYYEKALRGMVRFTPDERVLHWDNTKISR